MIRMRATALCRAAFLAVAAALALASVGAPAAEAPAWPTRPVRIVVPFAAGTFVDVLSRLIGEKLARALGQPVLIENRPGASGTIAAEWVAKSPADGYTLLNGGVFLTVLPAIHAPNAVEPTAFVPITRLTNAPMLIVVHPSLKVTTLGELVALARRTPGHIAYATSGIGTTPHLAAAMLVQRAGIDMLHVPYANTGAALKDVMSGEIPVMFTFPGTVEGQVRSRQLVPLAVTSAKRDPALPDVPTVAEQGFPGYEAATWTGLLAPAGTPSDVIDRLYRECARIVADSEVRERLIAMGNEPVGNTPAEFAAEIKAEAPRWKEIADKAGIRLD